MNPTAIPPEAVGLRPVLAANTIPRFSRAHELVIRGIALGAYGFALYWLWWRWTSSLNWTHPVFSILLVSAETWGVISMASFIFTAWRLVIREPPPAPDALVVDVFITCYDEPLQLLRRTAIGARAIRYPHRTYLLDDGKRDEVMSMCSELGVGYIRREGNEHAKAGNLNHALTVTDGEFILQLDADHVPLPNILDRLLGYFNDERLAFVQSPQDFYNTDSFTHVVNDEGRQMWEENRLFFSLIQPGKDRINASFFCGSCGVLRRTALDAIGGFSTETITEDMETSMKLHSLGWKSAYHGETLAYGLAPASAAQYHVQRLRWGQGSMQILRKMNPLTYSGLSWPQRISYFSSVTVYLDGIQRLIFYLAPVWYFTFGALPVVSANRDLLVRLIPYMLLNVGSFELLARGTGYILIAERYNMTRFWTYIRATSGYFAKERLKFNVTPKGVGEVPFTTYAPQLVLAIVSVASLVWALIARHFRWIDYNDTGGASAAFIVNGFWVSWNVYFAMYVVKHSIKSRQMRGDYRFVLRLPTRVRTVVEGQAVGDGKPATTEDLNSAGMSFRCTSPFEPGAMLEIPLSLGSGTIVTRGIVTHRTTTSTPVGNVHLHGVEFRDVPLEVRDAIELNSAHHAIPAGHQLYRQSLDVVENALQRFINPRQDIRRAVGLPALVSTTSDTGDIELGMGMLEEESRGGVRLILENPIEPGTFLRWDVPGTATSGSGTVIFTRSIESPLRVSFVVGVQRDIEPRLGLLTWRKRGAPDTVAVQ